MSRLSSSEAFGPESPLTLIVSTKLEYAQAIRELQDGGWIVRVLPARQARNKTDFFNTAAKLLSFPEYFGMNWAAFSDSFSDMDWLIGEPNLALVFTDADQLLIDEPAEQQWALCTTLRNVANEYAEPIDSRLKVSLVSARSRHH